MSKKFYLAIFFFSLLVLSMSFLFQKTPGYMDSEYYFSGAKYLARGENTAPFVWNYLDNPSALPHNLFTYWMPFPSIWATIPMLIFGNDNLFFGRMLFWFLAACLPVLTAYVSNNLFRNKFSTFISAFFALFCGFYFKYLTIPESITLYIFFGGLLFFIFNKFSNSKDRKKSLLLAAILGLICGVLHLSRVDGILFFGMILYFFIIRCIRPGKDKKANLQQTIWEALLFAGCYFLVTAFWYVRNLGLFSSFFSPASSSAIWIANYEDTFVYPASKLTFDYWLQNGLPVKGLQIWKAIKQNFGSLLGVQLEIIGIPLFILSIRKNWKSKILLFPFVYFLLVSFMMTFVFSEAGSRGGFLHSLAAVQILVWVLMADGLSQFIAWGIKKRGWVLKRSQKMFGTAIILFSIIFTMTLYLNDVIGSDHQVTKWDQEAQDFVQLENQIEEASTDLSEVVMINDPVGFHLATNRWSIVIPTAEWEDLQVLIQKFDVRFVVLDQNLPSPLKDQKLWLEKLDLHELYRMPSGKILYEID
jgi:hypothetical protein